MPSCLLLRGNLILETTSFFHSIEMKNQYNRIRCLTQAPLESWGSKFVSSRSAEEYGERQPALWLCQLFSKLHARVKKIKDKEDEPHLLIKHILYSPFSAMLNHTIGHKSLYTLYEKWIITAKEAKKHTSKNIMFPSRKCRNSEPWTQVFNSESF